MTPLAASISDATIWSVTFDDTRSIDYDHNSFIIQATGQFLENEVDFKTEGSAVPYFVTKCNSKICKQTKSIND